MAIDAYAEMYQKKAIRVAMNLHNGNLEDAIDILFDDEDPVGVVIVALHLVQLLTLDGVASATDVTVRLIGLIDRWDNDN